jgi:hypothetical protein
MHASTGKTRAVNAAANRCCKELMIGYPSTVRWRRRRPLHGEKFHPGDSYSPVSARVWCPCRRDLSAKNCGFRGTLRFP